MQGLYRLVAMTISFIKVMWIYLYINFDTADLIVLRIYLVNSDRSCIDFRTVQYFIPIWYHRGTDAVTLDSSLFTLLSSNTDGSCPTAISTDQIKFKEDSRTGCTIS